MFKLREFEEITKEFYNNLIEVFPNLRWGTESNAYKIMYLIMREVQRIEERQQSYIDKNNYLKAEGQDLDLLLNGRQFPRNKASKAKGYWKTINSIPGTSALARTIKFEDEKGNTFLNTEPFTIDDTGTAEFSIECEEAGEQGNVKAGTINRIKTPIRGLVSGENVRDLSGGTNLESDYDYRIRWERNRGGEAYWNSDGIEIALLNVSGVKSAKVIENDDDDEIEIGGKIMPSRSRRYYVYGGAEEDIAKAIYKKTDRAIKETGDITVTVLDRQGDKREIRFSRPVEIKISHKIVLEGYVDTELVTSFVKNYINESPINHLFTSFQIVEKIRHSIDTSQVKNLEIHFSKDGENYFSSLQIDKSEKGVI